MSKWERAARTVMDELCACYQRDRKEIETAHQVMTEIRELSGSDA